MNLPRPPKVDNDQVQSSNFVRLWVECEQDSKEGRGEREKKETGGRLGAMVSFWLREVERGESSDGGWQFFFLARCNGSRGYWQSLTTSETSNGNTRDFKPQASGQVPISL